MIEILEKQCLSEYRIDRHLLGLENEVERAETLAHLDACSHCHAEHFAMQKERNSFLAKPGPLPEVIASYDESLYQQHDTNVVSLFERGWVRSFSIAASIALVVMTSFFGYRYLQQQPTDPYFRVRGSVIGGAPTPRDTPFSSFRRTLSERRPYPSSLLLGT